MPCHRSFSFRRRPSHTRNFFRGEHSRRSHTHSIHISTYPLHLGMARVVAIGFRGAAMLSGMGPRETRKAPCHRVCLIWPRKWQLCSASVQFLFLSCYLKAMSELRSARLAVRPPVPRIRFASQRGSETRPIFCADHHAPQTKRMPDRLRHT